MSQKKLREIHGNLKEVIRDLLKIVDKKEDVEINEIQGEKSIIFEVKVAQEDMGKVIGKQGRLAKSIRTVIRAVANREQKRVTVEFLG